jgi:hypothetical protein
MAAGKDISAGRAFVELAIKNSAFYKGLRDSQKQLQAWGKAAAVIGASLAAAGAAIVAPLTAAAHTFADSGKELFNMSARTGVSAQALSELGFAARRAGTDSEGLEHSLKHMTKHVGQAALGNQEAAASLATIGLSVNQLRGLSIDKQFEVISNRIAGVVDPSVRAAAALGIFGKNGLALMPLMLQGAAGIQSLRAEAQKLGVSRSNESVAQANKLAGLFGRMKEIINGTVLAIGQAMAPAMIRIVQIQNSALLLVQKFVKQYSGLVPVIFGVGSALIAAGTVIAAIGAGVFTIGTAFGAVASAVLAVGGFLATPLGAALAIGAAVIGIAAAWMRFTELGRQTAATLWGMVLPIVETIKATVKGVSDAIGGGDLILAGQIAIKGLQLVFMQGLGLIASSISTTLGDALGSIASDLIKGDFLGAWQTVIASMGKLWADFSQGVVRVFTAAAQAVTDRWQATVNSIANGLLKASSQGGVVGKIASLIVGADVGELQKENDRLDKARGLKPQNLLELGSQSVNDSTNALRGPIDNWFASLNEVAGDKATEAERKFRARVPGGAAENEQGKLQAELDNLRKQAAAAQKKVADEAANKPAMQQLGDFSMGKMAVAGGFSAEGLAAQLNGGPQERMSRSLEDIRREARRQNVYLENIAKKNNGFGIVE